MILKFGGPCSLCGKPIPAGTEARYDGETKTVQGFVGIEPLGMGDFVSEARRTTQEGSNK